MAEVRVIRRGLRRLRPWALGTVLATALVAYLLVGYLRVPDPFRQRMELTTEGDLARILSSLSGESQTLEEELSALKIELANLQNASANQDTKTEAVNAQLNALQVLAGTTPVKGPGISVVIADPQRSVTFDVLLGVVQELRDAGAEAIAVNGRRVGARSYFASENSSVSLDGVSLSSPYNISAIGSTSALEGGLKIPGGSLDTLKAEEGVAVDVSKRESLSLPALENAPAFRAAVPVPER